VNHEGTLETIGNFYKETGYLLDPHSAVGVRAALDLISSDKARICLATAHPAKFGEAVNKAIGVKPPVPDAIAALSGMQTRCEVMEVDLIKVKEFMISNLM